MTDTWWAAVRYTDGEMENVSVQKIKNFQPAHVTDYEQGYKYTVKTSAWNNEGKEEKYKAYIVRLAQHYLRYLKRLNYKEPGLSATLQEMPAMLADRATDLGGRRGKGRRACAAPQVPQDDDDDQDDILDPETGTLRPATKTILNEMTGEVEVVPVHSRGH